MAVPGRPPKDDGEKRTRVPMTHQWVDVPEVLFDGPPLTRLRPDVTWPIPVLAWWDAVRTMPHCALWSAADWTFAAETALLVLTINSGDGGLTAGLMGQLTRRELELGMTEPARRQQRIRYVPPEDKPAEQPQGGRYGHLRPA